MKWILINYSLLTSIVSSPPGSHEGHITLRCPVSLGCSWGWVSHTSWVLMTEAVLRSAAQVCSKWSFTWSWRSQTPLKTSGRPEKGPSPSQGDTWSPWLVTVWTLIIWLQSCLSSSPLHFSFQTQVILHLLEGRISTQVSNAPQIFAIYGLFISLWTHGYLGSTLVSNLVAQIIPNLSTDFSWLLCSINLFNAC